MLRLRNLAPLLLLGVGLAACVADDAAPLPGDDGDDRLADVKWDWSATKEAEVTTVETDATFEVVVDGKTALVKGPIFAADIPTGGKMELSVTSRGLDSLTDDLQFMLMIRDERGKWSPKEFLFEYELDGVPSVSKLSTFDSVTYFPAEDRISAVNGVVGEFEKSKAGLQGVSSVGIFALPEEVSLGIGLSLDGSYDFTIEASCDGRPCDRDPFRGN